MITNKEQQVKEIRDWIDDHVSIDSCTQLAKPDKIDILQRMLDELRVFDKKLDNEFPFEESLDWCVFTGGDQLIAQEPPLKERKRHSTGTPSVSLQVSLLVFLLSKLKKPQYVHGEMNDFIHEIWEELQPEDFKRLRTGRFRCFTNAGFAATELRNAGFLRCGNAEHHKTWKLSLIGILAAADAIHQHKWKISDTNQGVGSPTNIFIEEWSKQYAGYDSIVKGLQKICEPDSKFYETFDPILKRAGQLMAWHQGEIKRAGILVHEKRKISRYIIEELEKAPLYDKFMTELVESIQLDLLMAKVPYYKK